MCQEVQEEEPGRDRVGDRLQEPGVPRHGKKTSFTFSDGCYGRMDGRKWSVLEMMPMQNHILGSSLAKVCYILLWHQEHLNMDRLLPHNLTKISWVP